MEIRQVFPERLRLLRESLGLTVDEFAHKVKIPRSSMQLYEGGKRVPNIVVLGRICGAASCSPEYLMGFVPAKLSKKKSNQKGVKEPDLLAGIRGMFVGGSDDTLDAFMERKHRDKELYES